MILSIKSNTSLQLLAGILMAVFLLPAQARVSASFDINPVTEGDPVVLTIRQQGQSTAAKPDLSPLRQDFEILGNNQSSQVSIINGRRSDLTSWSISLLPRHPGTIHIGPIPVGQEQTVPLTLEVKKASAQQATANTSLVFMEMSTDATKEGHYVQQEIPVTVRLFYRNRLQQGKIGDPQPDHTVVERLGEDKQYSTMRKGHQYQVIERHYAIFPEKSGSLTIPPAKFRGQISMPRAPGQRRQSVNDPFGNDPFGQAFSGNNPFANDPFFKNNFFGNSPFGNPGKPITVRSNPLTLGIKPRPQSWTGGAWLPARSVTLQDSWEKQLPRFRVGDPVTRTVTLLAQGLEASQIPPLDLPQPPGFRLYTNPAVTKTRTDGNNVYGSSQRTYTYIPGRSGSLVIPEYRLNWWNTLSKKKDQTRLQKWQVTVQAGAATSALQATKINPSVRANSSSATAPEPQTIKEKQRDTRRWWLKIFLIFALVAGILRLLWRHATKLFRKTSRVIRPGHQSTPITTEDIPVTPKRSELRRNLKNACQQNNPQAAAKALLELAADHWPDDPPRSLGAVAKHMESGSAEIQALEQTLYARTGSTWQGASLWLVLKQGFNQSGQKIQQHNARELLPPLYPE